MHYNPIELDKLRKKVRVAFMLRHQDDDVKKNSIYDEAKSYNNSFLLALSKDLNDLFGDKAPKAPTLYNLYFEERTSFRKATINYLNAYCDSQNSSKDSNTKNLGTLNENKNSLKRIRGNVSEFLRSNYLKIIGYLFFYLPFIVFPIASIGIYKNFKSDKDPSKKATGYFLYSGMIFLYICVNILAIIFLAKSNLGMLIDANQSFDSRIYGNGIVSVSNLTKDGRGQKQIVTQNSTNARVGDTILVSILVGNISSEPIENIDIELSPRISGSNKKHTFSGSLSGYKTDILFDNAFVNTNSSTNMRYIDKSYMHFENLQSDLLWLNSDDRNDLYAGGYKIDKLYPGKKNFSIISSLYVVEESTLNSGIFHSDPAGKNLGFFTVNNCQFKCANKLESINVSSLKKDDTFNFFTFVDFQNIGTVNITNARAKLFVDTSESDKYLKINAELSGDNVLPIYDSVKIFYDNKDLYLGVMEAYVENQHGDTNPKDCAGYNLIESLKINEIEDLVAEIGTLDTYKGGFCDQGYFVVHFQISRNN